MQPRRLGKAPAYHDVRVPRFSAVLGHLPAPPLNSCWFADVPNWLMLGNDHVGNCVECAALHWIWQQRCYNNPGNAVPPTDAEAIGAYSDVTGFDPEKPETDLGSYVLGDSGVMQHWLTNGLMCGGKVDRLVGYASVDIRQPMQWRQAINTFGGLMVGFAVPQHVLDSDPLPFIWDNPAGPRAGDHEVFLTGYEQVADTYYYDVATWGERIRMTQAFLLALIDEAVVAMFESDFDAESGLNAAGLTRSDLAIAMRALQAEAGAA